jgi:hypothetical protein
MTDGRYSLNMRASTYRKEQGENSGAFVLEVFRSFEIWIEIPRGLLFHPKKEDDSGIFIKVESSFQSFQVIYYCVLSFIELEIPDFRMSLKILIKHCIRSFNWEDSLERKNRTYRSSSIVFFLSIKTKKSCELF